jgi:hypothetical protein
MEIFGVRAGRFVPPKKNQHYQKFAHVRKAVQELDPTPNQSYFFSWADQRVLIEESFEFATHFKGFSYLRSHSKTCKPCILLETLHFGFEFSFSMGSCLYWATCT